MKIPEMAWITQINYALSSVYCIYFFIQNVYLFCLLVSSATSVTGYVDFFVWGHPLASSMNEKDIILRFHRQGLSLVLD